ncbi:MAG: S8 family serine peptidase [Gemmataceae bacterium]|nr:S8 family serine peptidase [Gemmataceae bacterium]
MSGTKHARRLNVERLEDRCVLATLLPDQLLLTSVTGQVSTVRLAAGTSAADAIASYAKDASVASVEQAQLVSVSVIPDDASFGSQYALRNTGQSGGTSDADIDADQAWDLTTGSMRIAVGVIDTGIDYRHPDLYRNIWINQGEVPVGLGVIDTDSDGLVTFRDLNASANSSRVSDLNGNGYIDAGDLLADSRWENGSDDDGNGYADDLVGWDFVNNDNDPMDDNNHGTHVAGTIGAVGNNGLGVSGVAWNVRLAALKFLGANGSGSTAGALDALEYAVENGIQVSNNSWGGGGYSSAFNTALGNARAAGHVFVAAAGNASSDNDATANYPSNYSQDNVIAVASTDRNDALSGFSNYGAATVDLAAPGSSIYSTLPNGTYGSLSGTSMATPHVAGTVALVWSADPTQTYSQVISRVLNNTDAVSGLTGKVATGGRLNAYKAVSAAVPAPVGPRVLSAVANTVSGPSSVQVTFSKAIDPATFTAADITGFTGPNGSIAVTSVTAVAGSGNTRFNVNFAAQTTIGTYRFDLGPDIRDAAGNRMDQDQDGIGGEATGDSFRTTFAANGTFSNTTAVAIRDFATAASSITVGADVKIGDLDAKVNLTHTYDGDLRIYLKGPDGTQIDLSRYRGGSGDNFANTLFDDEAGTAISAGKAPFSGSYRPEGLLSSFDGKSAKGTWTLYVYDSARYDTGTLKSWSLVVTPQLSPAALAAGAEEGAAALSSASVPASAAPFGAPMTTAQANQAAYEAVAAMPRREAVDAVFAQLGRLPRVRNPWATRWDEE